MQRFLEIVAGHPLLQVGFNLGELFLKVIMLITEWHCRPDPRSSVLSCRVSGGFILHRNVIADDTAYLPLVLSDPHWEKSRWT